MADRYNPGGEPGRVSYLGVPKLKREGDKKETDKNSIKREKERQKTKTHRRMDGDIGKCTDKTRHHGPFLE